MSQAVEGDKSGSVAAAQASQEVETVENQKPSRVDLLKEVGFENVADDEDAFNRLYEAYRQQIDTTKTLSEQVQLAIEELRASKQPEQKRELAGDDSWWNPPNVDLSTVQRYKTPDGAWKPETPADIRSQGDAAQRFYDKWADDLVRRPNEVLPKIIQQEAKRVVQEMLGKTTEAQREAQVQEQVFSENEWLFEKHPITGKPDRSRLSSEGQLLNQHFVIAQQKGLGFEDAWDLAYSKHQLAKLTAQQKGLGREEADEANEQRKKDLLNRASGGTINKGGSLTPPADKGKQNNKSLSLGERLKQNAAKAGIDLEKVWA